MNKKKLIIALSITAVVIAGAFIGMKIRDDRLPRYTVSFDTNGGTQIDSIEVKQGYKIPKPEDPIKNGYHVKNWDYQDKAWVFDSDVVRNDMTLTATWDYDNYFITYNFDGGTYDGGYKTTYDIDTEFTLIRPTKQGNIFGGWFDENGNRIDEITKGMTGDLTLTARWIDGLIINSGDETKGTIYVCSEEEGANKVTVKHLPINNKYHLFTGWYDNEGNLLSKETDYTFSLGDEVTYINSHYMSDEEENEWNLEHGVIPTICWDSNNYVKYGMYPQSNVNDVDLIDKLNHSELTTLNGYYYYNHEYYSKRKAKIAKDTGTGEPLPIHDFDNGNEIIEGADYWFKVEPITWRVLENKDNNYLLLSEKLIEVKQYNTGGIREIDGKTIMPNNYKYSKIREWLNGSFYNNAFFFNKDSIQLVEINNSASTTATPESGFECENTFDNVTLLSFKDYSDGRYGFLGTSATPARRFLTTDYVRADAAQYSIDIEKPYTGYCWTRSPIETAKNNGYCVSRNNKNGTLNSDYVGFNESCVQPALTISYIL